MSISGDVDLKALRKVWALCPSQLLSGDLKPSSKAMKLFKELETDSSSLENTEVMSRISCAAAHGSIVNATGFLDIYSRIIGSEDDPSEVAYERLSNFGVGEFLTQIPHDVRQTLYDLLPNNCREVGTARLFVLVRGILYAMGLCKKETQEAFMDVLVPNVAAGKAQLTAFVAAVRGILSQPIDNVLPTPVKQEAPTEQPEIPSLVPPTQEEEVQAEQADKSQQQLDHGTAASILGKKTIQTLRAMAKAHNVKLTKRTKEGIITELLINVGPQIVHTDPASEASSVMEEDTSQSGLEKNKENDEEPSSKTPARGKRKAATSTVKSERATKRTKVSDSQTAEKDPVPQAV